MLGASGRSRPTAISNRLPPVSWAWTALLAPASTVRVATTSPVVLSTTRISMATSFSFVYGILLAFAETKQTGHEAGSLLLDINS